LSRVTDFDEVYTGARDRLLLQLYAYCGNADAADDALNEAFINASHHWHRVNSSDTVEGWLRGRAVRRLDGRVRALPQRRAGEPSRANARLLAVLGALDPTTRRLLIVRRLGDLDMSTAAREVGLTDGAAEQALARATLALHGNGIDTTPAGLHAGLHALREDLTGVHAVPARGLRRAGARRRYAAGGLVAVLVVGVAAGSGALAAASHPVTSPPTSTPTPSTGPTTSPPPTMPPPHLDESALLSAEQISHADAHADWRVVPSRTPPETSVYGECVQAADNPPPNGSWIRDFTTGTVPKRSRLRQVVQLAPSLIEANRAYRQIVSGFGLCEGRQLADFARVRPLGDRSQLIRLLQPNRAGSSVENVLVSVSGPAVVFLSVRSPAGVSAALSLAQLTAVAGQAVDRVCTEAGGGCSFPPYKVTDARPLEDVTAGGFLSVADLPFVPHVTQPWAGTDPARVSDNPSATACDQTAFADNGGTDVTSRSYVIPAARGLPTLFGLTETRATFSSGADAKAFVADVAQHVASCHRRQVTLSVVRSTSFTVRRTTGEVWQVQQRVSKRKTVTFRVALVRLGATVAEVTFTPVGAYDVSQPQFLALAQRAAVRLGQ
jgi:DNA-directed RNA polymerase specialized sigma24 family protein